MSDIFKLSVVVVNYNSWSSLIKLIDCLKTQEAAFELIIVDNASTVAKPKSFDKKIGELGFDCLLLENDENLGFAAACNHGASHAKAPVLLFCNPDVMMPDHGLDELLSSYYKSEVNLLSCCQQSMPGKLVNAHGNFPTMFRFIPVLGGLFKAKKIHQNSGIHVVDWISGSVIMIGHHDFLAINAWTEDYFMFMEDVDLCLKASKNNMLVAVDSDITWIHEHGVSSKSSPKDRINSKTQGIKSKHRFVNNHFKGINKQLTHLMIFLKVTPELVVSGFFSWLMPSQELKNKRAVLKNYLLWLISANSKYTS